MIHTLVRGGNILGARQAILDHSERGRRHIVTLVFFIYWLLLLEGTLRKWVFPEYHMIVFFIRDPFALVVYAMAIYYRAFSHQVWLMLGILLVGAGAVLGALQLATTSLDLLIVGYGWRNYFFYIPMAFVIGACFRREDLWRLVRHTLLLALPMAALSTVQAISPPDAVINQGAFDDPESAFGHLGVAFNVIRAQGTFTSPLGLTMYLGSAVAMVLAVWVAAPKERPVSGWALALGTIGVGAALAASGSRFSFVFALLLVIAALASGSLLAQRAVLLVRALVVPAAVAIIAMVLMPILSPVTIEALVERTVGAAEDVNLPAGLDLPYRVYSELTYPVLNILPEAPLLGIGLGLGGNASVQLGYLVREDIEEDWSRNFMELGLVLGPLYVLFRIALVVWLFKGGLGATRRSGNLLPLLLVVFAAVPLFNGQITAHGTVNGYGWLFAGFAIAAIRSFGLRHSTNLPEAGQGR